MLPGFYTRDPDPEGSEIGENNNVAKYYNISLFLGDLHATLIGQFANWRMIPIQNTSLPGKWHFNLTATFLSKNKKGEEASRWMVIPRLNMVKQRIELQWLPNGRDPKRVCVRPDGTPFVSYPDKDLPVNSCPMWHKPLFSPPSPPPPEPNPPPPPLPPPPCGDGTNVTCVEPGAVDDTLPPHP